MAALQIDLAQGRRSHATKNHFSFRITSRHIWDSTPVATITTTTAVSLMRTNPNSQSGLFTLHSLSALSLCSLGVLLAIASLTVGPRNATADTTASGARIYVTTTAQKIGGIGTGGCSLQEAIYSSILPDSLDGGAHGIAIDATDPDSFIITACVMGTGTAGTIILPSGGVFSLRSSL